MSGQCDPFLGVHIVHRASGRDLVQFAVLQPGAGHPADLLRLQGDPQSGKGVMVGPCGQVDRHRPLSAQVCCGRSFAHLNAQQPVFSGQQVNDLWISAQVQKGELIVLQAHCLQVGQAAQVDLGHGGVTHPQVDHGLILPQLQTGQRPAQIGEIFQVLVAAQVQLLNKVVSAGKVAQRRVRAHVQACQTVGMAVQNPKLRRAGRIQLAQAVIVAEERLQLGGQRQIQGRERVVVAVQIFQVRKLFQPLQGHDAPVANVHTNHLLPLRNGQTSAGIGIQAAHVIQKCRVRENRSLQRHLARHCGKRRCAGGRRRFTVRRSGGDGQHCRRQDQCRDLAVNFGCWKTLHRVPRFQNQNRMVYIFHPTLFSL